MGDLVKNLVVWTIIAVVIMSLFSVSAEEMPHHKNLITLILCSRFRLDKLKKYDIG